MSFGTAAGALGDHRLRSRFMGRTAARLVLTLGLAASLAVVTPTGGLAAAGASVVPAAHNGPGGGGNQGGGNQGGGFGKGGPGGFRHLVIVSGTVGTVGTTSFTLTRGFGPITPVSLTGTATTVTGLTINVSQHTRFVAPGMTSHGLSAVLVGDKVTVTGSRAGSGMVNASLVVIPLEIVTGAVGTVGTDSFTISLRPMSSLTSTATTLTGTATAWTIDVSGSTKFRERGVSSSTLSLGGSISSGDHVTVVGSQAGTLTLDAITIQIVPSHATRGRPGGGGGGPGGGGGGGGPGGGKHHPHGF